MKSSLSLALTLVLLCGTMAIAKFSDSREPDSLARHLETIPVQIADWAGKSIPGPSEQEESKLLATEHLSRVYRREDHTLVELWVAYYSQQKAGETMHSPKACLPGAGWEAVDYGFVDVPVPGRPPVKVNQYVVAKGGDKLQVLYWYQSPQRIVASEYTGKGFLILDSVLGRTTGGALVRLTLPAGPTAIEEEIALASHIIPAMDACLRRDRQSAGAVPTASLFPR